MRRRDLVLLVLVAAVVAVGTTLAALLIPWLPESASEQRDRIDTVFWLATGISIFIFSVVVGTIAVAVVRFRARPDDDTDGPPVHGHTGLEIVWTAVPTALVTAIAVLSALVLHENGNAGANPLTVKVTAEQFTWRFAYESGSAKGASTPTLTLPLGQAVKLVIVTKDVLHSFWVPEFGQKQDAVPGADNTLVITPTKLGTFPVVCTELCGLGHSLMRSSVTVLQQARFDAWAKTQTKGGA